jgi:hypothetical protein
MKLYSVRLDRSTDLYIINTIYVESECIFSFFVFDIQFTKAQE